MAVVSNLGLALAASRTPSNITHFAITGVFCCAYTTSTNDDQILVTFIYNVMNSLSI